MSQGVLIVLISGIQGRVEMGLTVSLCLLLRSGLLARYFQASGVGECFHGLRKVDIVVVHHKADGVSARATAKAIIKLLVWVNAERRRLFFVKRAASRVILAGLFQFYSTINDFHNIGAVEQGVDKALWNESGHGLCTLPKRLLNHVLEALPKDGDRL